MLNPIAAALLAIVLWMGGPGASASFAQVMSPSDFLGYELGRHFTPHHRVVAYFEHVAEESDRVTLEEYGTTYERRRLVLATVTSPQNHADLEEIRLNNLRMTGLEPGEPTDNRKAIVWLSYNVHGDEASSSEAAMRTVYELATRTDAEVSEWMQNTVVLMDPMLNPDGRDRYVGFVTQNTGMEPDPTHIAQEHAQPWPGGRANHYLFDLNRDWAWMVLRESRQRSEAYHRWMPHVHVDFHEQGYDSPYYFAPAAEPFHKAITPWQREFQQVIGTYNMEAFDREGWVYFTREVFDLFYPSYGDTWPTFNGAVGMTYEQAGGGFAGLSVRKPEGDELTLLDRLTHHHTAGMATIAAASDHAARVVREFQEHFQRAAARPDNRHGSYVIPAAQNPDKLAALLRHLEAHRIRVERAASGKSTTAYVYATGREARVQVQAGDLVIPAAQPKAQLVRALFEPRPELSDSVTYDITAWEAPYRFGLTGYALSERIGGGQAVSASDFTSEGGVVPLTGSPAVRSEAASAPPTAYVMEWASMDDARFLADWLGEGGMARTAMEPFRIGAREFGRGSLVLSRVGNPDLPGAAFDSTARALALRHGRTLHAAASSAVSAGSDFGASSFRLITPFRIAMLSRDGTSSLSNGELWQFMEEQLGYAPTRIPVDRFDPADLTEFDVLVLPSGGYGGMGSEAWAGVLDWVRSGGVLVSVGGSVGVLARQQGFDAAVRRSAGGDGNDRGNGDGNGDANGGQNGGEQVPPPGHRYSEREREAVKNFNTGSIYRVTVDPSHPLAFGYPDGLHLLNTSRSAYDMLEDGWNVGTFGADSHLSGFVGSQAAERFEHSMAFGVQEAGRGQVVYLPVNPMFRGFWEDAKLLFVNALFMVGSR